ncbi:hypothetical protein F511_24782 [Dorcoceras hygrometricum]|uniref:Uncharacterized protein n=1 Tax=Dorcoceras hygrometricum TaxID=472368 RepID=A0A2Z7CND1_9LAMI|nr:hypothetical protein F511_24782 [Dorcoceras hygrometricum]
MIIEFTESLLLLSNSVACAINSAQPLLEVLASTQISRNLCQLDRRDSAALFTLGKSALQFEKHYSVFLYKFGAHSPASTLLPSLEGFTRRFDLTSLYADSIQKPSEKDCKDLVFVIHLSNLLSSRLSYSTIDSTFKLSACALAHTWARAQLVHQLPPECTSSRLCTAFFRLFQLASVMLRPKEIDLVHLAYLDFWKNVATSFSIEVQAFLIASISSKRAWLKYSSQTPSLNQLASDPNQLDTELIQLCPAHLIKTLLAVAIKKILYCADEKESALAEAQEIVSRSVNVAGEIEFSDTDH